MSILLWLSSFSYLIGCFLLIPSSIFLNIPNFYLTSIILFTISCSFLLIASIFDVLWMYFINKDEQGREVWWLILLCYFFGGICFTLGSILFLPTISLSSYGVWVFRYGSISYSLGTVILLIILEEKKKKIFKIIACCSYLSGSFLYFTGGILSQVKLGYIGNILWVGGSIMFFLGAFINIILNLYTKLNELFNKNNENK
jgi:hypothetical protein